MGALQNSHKNSEHFFNLLILTRELLRGSESLSEGEWVHLILQEAGEAPSHQETPCLSSLSGEACSRAQRGEPEQQAHWRAGTRRSSSGLSRFASSDQRGQEVDSDDLGALRPSKARTASHFLSL